MSESKDSEKPEAKSQLSPSEQEKYPMMDPDITLEGLECAEQDVESMALNTDDSEEKD